MENTNNENTNSSSENESKGDSRERSFGDSPRDDSRRDSPRDDSRRDSPRDDSRRDGPRSDSRRDGPRSDSRRDGPRRDYGPRRDGPRRDYGPRRDDSRSDAPRSDAPRSDDSRSDAPRRDYGPRSDAPRRDYGPRRDGPRRDYGPRRDGPRRDYGPRRDGPRRDYGPRSDDTRNENVVTEEERGFTKDSFKKKVSFDVNEFPAKKNFFKDKDHLESKPRAKTGRIEIAVGNLSANLNVMISAAHKAGRGLLYDFAELSKLNIQRKEDQSLVSEADFASEKMLVANLNKTRPEFGFLLEEGGEKEGTVSSKKFIIDPLDGTSNFLHGIPHFAISIAMVVDDEVVASVIYNPILDETFYAEKGNGAYILNSGTCRRIRVSETSKFADSIIVTGIPNARTPNHEDFCENLDKVMSQVEGIRRTGSCALDIAYVAAGRFDGYFEMSMLKPWDFAAGLLLIREAGGYVCSFDKEEQDKALFQKDSILVCNDRLKSNFKNMLLK